jgi:aspartyl-tRNA(Asn)/glutamyl-tRNA(Gln) amidotransferase subunit B
MFRSHEDPDTIVDRLWVRQKNDTAMLETIVDEVLADSPNQIADYKAWKMNIFWFLVGQCMKASKGQGNPKIFTDILKRRLSE